MARQPMSRRQKPCGQSIRSTACIGVRLGPREACAERGDAEDAAPVREKAPVRRGVCRRERFRRPGARPRVEPADFRAASRRAGIAVAAMHDGQRANRRASAR